MRILVRTGDQIVRLKLIVGMPSSASCCAIAGLAFMAAARAAWHGGECPCWALMQDWPLLVHTRHRPCRARSTATRAGRLALGRGADPPHRPTREVRDRALQGRAAPGAGRHRLGDRVATLAWNTWRHLEAWYGITGIGAIYHTRQPAAVRGPDRLHHQPRRGPAALPRPDLRAAGREARGAAAQRRALVVLTDAAHMPADEPAQRRRLRGLAGRGRRRLRLGELRREHRRRASATPRARPATPRACSTRTAPTCCTR